MSGNEPAGGERGRRSTNVLPLYVRVGCGLGMLCVPLSLLIWLPMPRYAVIYLIAWMAFSGGLFLVSVLGETMDWRPDGREGSSG